MLRSPFRLRLRIKFRTLPNMGLEYQDTVPRFATREEAAMPKRLPDSEKRDKQVLVRLNESDLDWLESAAHLERSTVSTYVLRLLRAHVASLATNEHVRADVE